MRGLIVVAAPVVRVSVAILDRGGALMIPECHALPGRNRSHALERHDERNKDSKQANEPQTHDPIVLQGFDRLLAARFRTVNLRVDLLPDVMRVHHGMPLPRAVSQRFTGNAATACAGNRS